MLGPTYRYQIYNGTGVTVTVTVKDRRWKLGTGGAVEPAAESTPVNAVAVGAGAYGNGGTVDNAAAHIGAHLTVTATPGASTTGLVSVYLQRSTDGGTTWPSDGRGVLLGTVLFSASAAAAATNMEVR